MPTPASSSVCSTRFGSQLPVGRLCGDEFSARNLSVRQGHSDGETDTGIIRKDDIASRGEIIGGVGGTLRGRGALKKKCRAASRRQRIRKRRPEVAVIVIGGAAGGRARVSSAAPAQP